MTEKTVTLKILARAIHGERTEVKEYVEGGLILLNGEPKDCSKVSAEKWAGAYARMGYQVEQYA
jgi:16S rRNA U516 pseudouridylate synthase RsuA-like enzyme